MVSLYWRNRGKTEGDRRPGKTFQRSDGLACDECCHVFKPHPDLKWLCATCGGAQEETKLITQDGPCTHFHRDSCPYCLGTSLNASCFDRDGNRIGCPHDRLNEDGICRQCGADRRRG
jgi:hypothetical protein